MRQIVFATFAIALVLTLICCGGSSNIGGGNGPSGGNGGSGSSSGSGGTSKPEVLYAAYYTPNGGGGGGSIVPMNINLTSGALNPLNSVLGPGNAVTIAADPGRKFLYSSDFNTNAVYAYAIDASSGNLTPLTGSPYPDPFFGNGGALAIDPVGNFLFLTNSIGDLTTYIRNSDGTLTLSSASAINDGFQPFVLEVDPSGKFLYAANHSDFNGEQISVFSIDPTTGGLSQIPGSPFSFAQSGSQPWGLALSNDGAFLFTALSGTGQIAVLSVNSSTGALTPIASSPFAAGQNMPEQLVLAPSGRYLYVGNALTSSISSFSVNPTSGALTGFADSLTNGSSILAVDPDGKFVFASTSDFRFSGSVWQINQNTGGVSQLGNIPSVNGPPTALYSIALP